jgi:hypothetical protein
MIAKIRYGAMVTYACLRGINIRFNIKLLAFFNNNKNSNKKKVETVVIINYKNINVHSRVPLILTNSR